MKKLIISLSTAALLAAPVFVFANQATDQLIQQLQEQIAALQAQIAALQSGSGFYEGDRVQVDTNSLKIRGDAGVHAHVLGKAPRGATGVLKCDSVPHAQCPITRDNYAWWYIDWDDASLPSGWSAEGSSEAQFLEKIASRTPSITVLSPNGGEQWQQGTTQAIKWLAPTSISFISISLVSWYACLYVSPRCAVAQRRYTLAGSIPNSGTFQWTVGKDASGADIPAGQYMVTVDGGGVSDVSDKPFSIVSSSSLAITTASLLSATVGAQYSTSIDASGGVGSYSWQITDGTLPPGLSTVTGDCIAFPCQTPFAIMGMPTLDGTYTFIVTVTDGTQKTSRSFSITVGKPPSFITVIFPNGGEQWPKGTTQVIKWSAPSSVPSVSISLEQWYACLYTTPRCLIAQRLYSIADSVSNNGALQWTVGKDKTGSDIPAGQYVLTVSGGTFSDTSDKPFSIVSSLAITTASLPGGTVGQTYSAQIAAIGGSDDYSWSVSNGSLPPGVKFVSAVCVAAPCQAPVEISGTPTSAGKYMFTVSVTDGVQTASQFFTLTVGKAVAAALSISPSNAILQIGKATELQAWYQPPVDCPAGGTICAQPAPYVVHATWTSSNSKGAVVAYKEIPCPAGTNCLVQQFDYLTAAVTGVSFEATGVTVTATYTDALGITFTATAKIIGTVMPSL